MTGSINQTAAERIARLFSLMEDEHGGLRARLIHFLVLVSNSPGINQREVVKKTGQSIAAVNRVTKECGSESWKGKPGLGLVEKRQSLADSRAFSLFSHSEGRTPFGPYD